MVEKAEIPVAMITTDNHNSGRVQNSDRGPYQGNKGNKNVSKTDETKGTRVSQMGNLSQNVVIVI